MEPPKGYGLIIRRTRRGLILFPILWIAVAVFGGIMGVKPGHRVWAVAALPFCVLIGLAGHQVRRRHISAWKVSKNPRIVYWAHPTTVRERLSEEEIGDCKLLMLHLRDGWDLEVNFPQTDMREFIAWLKEENPSMRWGPYDSVDSAAD